MVDQTSASWNPLIRWLRQIDQLMHAASLPHYGRLLDPLADVVAPLVEH